MSTLATTSICKPLTESVARATLRAFTVTARTVQHSTIRVEMHHSSIDAYMAAATAQGDTPCGITVMPAGRP